MCIGFYRVYVLSSMMGRSWIYSRSMAGVSWVYGRCELGLWWVCDENVYDMYIFFKRNDI